MKRFSIKDLPIRYSNEYNCKQMTINNLKNWKELGCLDNEKGILIIKNTNEIDTLFIGDGCPDTTDDITINSVKLAIYFDGTNLMVKAKSDVNIDYLTDEIDETIDMWHDEFNKIYDDVIRFEIGKKYRLTNGFVYECIDNINYKFKLLDDNNHIIKGTVTVKNGVELVTIDFHGIGDEHHFCTFNANNPAVPITFKVGAVHKNKMFRSKITKVTKCYVWINNLRYNKVFNNEIYCYEAFDNNEHYYATDFIVEK